MKVNNKLGSLVIAGALLGSGFGIAASAFATDPETPAATTAESGSVANNDAKPGDKADKDTSAKQDLASVKKTLEAKADAFKGVSAEAVSEGKKNIEAADSVEKAQLAFEKLALADGKIVVAKQLEGLKNLSPTEREGFKADLEKLSEDMLKPGVTAESLTGAVYGKAMLQDKKESTVARINHLPYLSDAVKSDYAKQVNSAATVGDVDTAFTAAFTADTVEGARGAASETISGLKNLSKDVAKEYLGKLAGAKDLESIAKIVKAATMEDNKSTTLTPKQKELIALINSSVLSKEDKATYTREVNGSVESELPIVAKEINDKIKFTETYNYAVNYIKSMNLDEASKAAGLKSLSEVAFNDYYMTAFHKVVTKYAMMEGDNNLKEGKLDLYQYGIVPHVWSGKVHVAGMDRFATAVRLSENVFPLGARTVFVASGENYPDALVAGPIAAKLGAPVLLSHQNSLDSNTMDEIKRLQPRQVIFIGGDKVVSKKVVASVVDALGKKVVTARFGGSDRYETVNKLLGTFTLPDTSLVLATGENYPDALVAGPVAGELGYNLALAPKTGVNAELKKTIGALKPKSIFVVGDVLNKDALKSLEKVSGVTVEQVGGKDRFATAKAVYSKFWSTEKTHYAVNATGLNFPDALTGAVAAIANRGPILLTKGTVSEGLYSDVVVPENQMLVGGVTTSIMGKEVKAVAKKDEKISGGVKASEAKTDTKSESKTTESKATDSKATDSKAKATESKTETKTKAEESKTEDKAKTDAKANESKGTKTDSKADVASDTKTDSAKESKAATGESKAESKATDSSTGAKTDKGETPVKPDAPKTESGK